MEPKNRLTTLEQSKTMNGVAFVEAEVIEGQIVDRIDESEFTKPG